MVCLVTNGACASAICRTALQAGKGEKFPGLGRGRHRYGRRKRLALALKGRLLTARAAGVAETQQLAAVLFGRLRPSASSMRWPPALIVVDAP